MLTCLCLTEFLHVNLAGDAVDAFDVVGRFQVRLFDLELYQSACQRHHADVMAGTGLYGNDVAFLQGQVVDVVIVTLTCMFKLHLYQVGVFGIAWYVSQPVVGVQLSVLTTYGLMAESSVTSDLDRHFFVVISHIYFNYSLFIFHYSLFTIHYFCSSSTIICRARSKNTILALAFCPMSRISRLANSDMARMLFSLMKRAKFLAKSSSF